MTDAVPGVLAFASMLRRRLDDAVSPAPRRSAISARWRRCATADRRGVSVSAARRRDRPPRVPALRAREIAQRARRAARCAANACARRARPTAAPPAARTGSPCGGPPDEGETATCRRAAPTGHNVLRSAGRERLQRSQTHCSDVVDWTAGTCIDPRHVGPYGVGVRDGAHDQGFRRHPRAPSACSIRSSGIRRPPDAGPVDTRLKGVVDAPLDNSGGPYPLLMFSHGSCGYAYQSTLPDAAARVVRARRRGSAAPRQYGLEFPTCGSGAARPRRRWSGRRTSSTPPTRCWRPTPTTPHRSSAPSTRAHGHVRSLVRRLHHLRRRQSGQRASASPCPMAPAVLASQAHLSVPSLSMMSELDSYVNNRAIHTAYAASNAPKMKVEIEHAGHFAYSDGCFPSPTAIRRRR